MDKIAELAAKLREHAAEYVLLAGSGVSRCSGIPTSAEIVDDLIRRLARRKDASPPRNPVQWFRERYGRSADYPTVLEELTDSPEERSRLLRTYFEPSDEERRRGIKLPAQAHRALAQLITRGYFRTVLTTNFDRLIEQGVAAAGLDAHVICAPEHGGRRASDGQRCTVIKLHGDYCADEMKNTPEELERYDPRLVRLVKDCLRDAGLLICGWSSEHDVALRRLIAQHGANRLPAYWAMSNSPNPDAASLVEQIGATVVPIADANQFFTDLAGALS